MRLVVLAMLPGLLLSNSVVTKDGKILYKAIVNKVGSTQNIIKSTVDKSSQAEEVISELNPIALPPKEREAYLKKQFISKDELMENQVLYKEDINIELEAIQFFDSLNSYEKKPIDIE